MNHTAQLPVEVEPHDDSAPEIISGKFLTFDIGNEEFAIYILRIREIIGYNEATPVPSAPPFLKGIINLRGTAIPIIDLRIKLGLPAREPDARTCIIVIEIKALEGAVQMGVIVDRVNEVMELKAEEVEKAPMFESAIGSAYILGLAKVNNRIKILLDVDMLIAGLDAKTLQDLTQNI